METKRGSIARAMDLFLCNKLSWEFNGEQSENKQKGTKKSRVTYSARDF